MKYSFDADDCVFLFVFDLRSILERKNPMGLLEAFREAFSRSDKTILVLNYINAKFNPEGVQQIRKMSEGMNVRIYDGHLGAEGYLALISASDCYVSLHRSEGLGIPMAEAMSFGKPVIGTGYSGNMEFMTDSNSLLVKYELKELERDYGPYEKGNTWAEPDIGNAAQLMRWVYENREEALDIGKNAQKEIMEILNPTFAAQEIRTRLEQIYAELNSSLH